jgi:hypothetical protein
VVGFVALYPPYICPPQGAPVIARLDRAIQKLAQHASWIIRSSRMMTSKNCRMMTLKNSRMMTP